MTYSAEQLELKAYIEKSNEEFIAQAKADGAVAWGVPMTELDAWAEYGVFNIAQYEHHQAAAEHYDLYKEVMGFRPRGMDYASMTTEQINAFNDSLIEDLKRQAEEDRVLDAAEEAARLERINANAYKPNLAFAGLGELLKTG